MIEIAVLLGANEDRAKSEVKEVMEFMEKLAKISLPMNVKDKDTFYNPTTLVEIPGASSKNLPQSWTKYVQKLFNYGDEEIDIQDTERVIIEDKNFYEKLSSVLGNQKKKTLANYAAWKVAFQTRDYLKSEELQKEVQKFDRAMMGTVQKSDKARLGTVYKEPRWKICTLSVGFNPSGSLIPRFHHAVDSMYARLLVDADQKVKAGEMADYLQKATSKMIDDADWMDDDTKKEAKKKLKNMKKIISFPDEVLNKQKVDDFYKGIVMLDDDYFGNVMKIDKHNNRKSDLRLRDPNVLGDWNRIFAAMAQAGYDPAGNLYQLAAGILQGEGEKH